MGNPEGSTSNPGQPGVISGLFWGFVVLILIGSLVACGFQNPLVTPTSTQLPPSPTAGPTYTPVPPAGSVAGFQHFLAGVSTLQLEQRQGKVNRYMAELTQAPITEGNTAIFLWQGTADSVQIIGDMNLWDPSSPLSLSRLEGSDLWYLQASFEPEARLDYQFEIGSGNRQLDPRNPNTIMSETGRTSVLKMSGYMTPPEVSATDAAAPAGDLSSHTLDSRFLDQTRTFIVYEPAGQIVGQKLPSLFLNDGGSYLNLINTPVLLDTLIAQRIIPPMVVVFLPPVLALDDYSQNDNYINFLADELVPYIQDNYGTDPDRAATGVMGSALGGQAAIYAQQTRPDVFGLAAGQSAVTSGLFKQGGGTQIDREPDRSGRIYLVVGVYETAVEIQGQRQDLLEDNRRLADELSVSGLEIQLEEMPEGHSWGLWQGTIGRALHYLYSERP